MSPALLTLSGPPGNQHTGGCPAPRPLPSLSDAGCGSIPTVARSGLPCSVPHTQIMQLLMKGNRQRTQEPTAANQTSSRSHAVLQVAVRQRSRVRNILQEVRQGRLFMVDLAGSERASQVRLASPRAGEEGWGWGRARMLATQLPEAWGGDCPQKGRDEGKGPRNVPEEQEGGDGMGHPGEAPRGCLREGAWECEGFSRERACGCPEECRGAEGARE